ncbi:OmpA family protein [Roseicella aquatilis]|uniref:OmpA family protein n=1 Tax=Roseicella aquatilis TaxID=2527868 RepID=A0A4R4DND9_9PROT|nr:OmpA family protein [Roseicella aquatilis]TCZ61372.1 OmpA family protein [Roseicella aquatilis]
MRRRLALAVLPLLALAACQPAPPPPASRAATVVFFTEDSAGLDDNARSIIEQAAAQAMQRPGAPVRVRGFTAPEAGTGAYNKALAATRAQHVADHLAAAGVARDRIRIEPRGAVPYESYPTESRRVEIVIGS